MNIAHSLLPIYLLSKCSPGSVVDVSEQTNYWFHVFFILSVRYYVVPNGIASVRQFHLVPHHTFLWRNLREASWQYCQFTSLAGALREVVDVSEQSSYWFHVFFILCNLYL